MSTRTKDLAVTVLGLGIMGGAMARNLARAGYRVTVWNRTPAAAHALVPLGARAATSPADAVAGARVVITMLSDADATDAVVFDGGAAAAFAPGAVWIQMGTIGVAETLRAQARMRELRPDVVFVDAPVTGSKDLAVAGQLLVLASGPDEAQAIVRPVLSPIARTVMWLGDAGDGSRMKLVLNAFMAIVIEGVAEAVELAERLGVDRDRLAELVEGGPLGSPAIDAKLDKMARRDYSAEFPLQWALKDVDLALEAAGASPPALLAALSPWWHAAVDAGLGRDDVSAARVALERHERQSP